MHKVENSAPLLMQKAKEAKENGQTSLVFHDIELFFENNLSYNDERPPEFFEKKPEDRPKPPDGDFRPRPKFFVDINGINIKPITYNNQRAELLELDGFKVVVVDIEKQRSLILIWSIFAVVTLLITTLYIFILKSLKPLNELRNSIEKFGSGNFQVEIKIDSNDEIGEIAKAFNEAARQVKYLIDSKDIFLKNAAHELRTPITKGMITVHLLPDNRDKEILLNAFKRLETISESVINLERFATKEFALNLEPIMLTMLINDASEMLFLEESVVDMDFEDMPILADENLMTIAFKNLIDNALKFSSNGRVLVCVKDGKVLFKNLSEPLIEPIDRYFDPFYKETSIRNARGSGLGLFLAKKIINAHGLKIEYFYENGYVIFSIG